MTVEDLVEEFLIVFASSEREINPQVGGFNLSGQTFLTTFEWLLAASSHFLISR